LLITYVIYADVKGVGLIGKVEHPTLVLIGGVLSHPLKSFLRWAFPYILLKGENRFRDYTRVVFGAIILGVLGNFVYALLTLGVTSFTQ